MKGLSDKLRIVLTSRRWTVLDIKPNDIREAHEIYTCPKPQPLKLVKTLSASMDGAKLIITQLITSKCLISA